jgi:hypothetical protein
MGWNVFYKECKYLAAHRILNVLDKCKGYNARLEGGEFTGGVHQWMNLNELRRKTKLFNKQMILDALKMLYDSNKEIDLMNGDRKSIETESKILPNGENALRERKYIRMFFKSAKVIAPIIVALLTMMLQYLRCILK